MNRLAASLGLALFALASTPARAADPVVRAAPAVMMNRGARAVLQLSDEELLSQLEADPESLGSMSMGRPNLGALIGGVQMTNTERYTVEAPAAAWGTSETVAYLKLAIDRVHDQFADTLPLFIGHLSRQEGGRLSPHKSHQSGRDVDISYYYVPKKHQWYQRAHARTLDLPRSWAFVRALVASTDVQWIFINSSVQKLLKKHALSIGENAEWLDAVFQYRSRNPNPIVRHARGHDTHIHIRFYNPVAQELARRLHKPLVKQGFVTKRFLRYRARKGDLLSRLARRFGTSVRTLKRVNRLRGSRIRAGRVYLIPRKGSVPPPPAVAIPTRRVPPVPASGGHNAFAAPASAPLR